MNKKSDPKKTNKHANKWTMNYSLEKINHHYKKNEKSKPIGSMYGRCIYIIASIRLISMVIVGKYTIHHGYIMDPMGNSLPLKPPKNLVEGGTRPSRSCASDNLLVLAFGRTHSSSKGSTVNSGQVTLPETNIAPKNGWLEYYFPIGVSAYFQV